MASKAAKDLNSMWKESFTDSYLIKSMSVTLSGTPGTETVITLPDTAKGFRLRPATNAIRFAVNETPAVQATSSDQAIAASVFAIGNAAKADVWETRLLPPHGPKKTNTNQDLSDDARTINIISTTGSVVVEVEIF